MRGLYPRWAAWTCSGATYADGEPVVDDDDDGVDASSSFGRSKHAPRFSINIFPHKYNPHREHRGAHPLRSCHLFVSLLGWAGLLLNNHSSLALCNLPPYFVLVWPSLRSSISGYLTSKSRSTQLEEQYGEEAADVLTRLGSTEAAAEALPTVSSTPVAAGSSAPAYEALTYALDPHHGIGDSSRTLASRRRSLALGTRR
ncbi:hypothetical protein GALMADRAFT_144676 [Galerina marginata CBS 339.88]|uniref:Uncharacterized protein n=1 Tax=Galerina marginata (strain CBS 339.88) TaxID=685588 RepID=A0A067SK41_GALM3|nr:hypothetical protein GALMADRAFT_144676 [Galerina marginata CBS 339.88]